MSQIIGVGTADTKYTREQLQMRSNVSLHCGLEAFVDLGTPDHSAVIIIMVDMTQRSRLGRILREPEYALLDDGGAIWDKWLSTVPGPYPWTCHAWFDCVMNNGLAEFKDFGCRPVLGSMGVGVAYFVDGPPLEDEEVWWEYGNVGWRVFSDFVTRLPTGDEIIDAHFWLEDAEGRVYDMLRPRLLLSLLNSGHYLPDETFPRAVDGKTKEELRAEGLHYLPAPRDTQRLLFSLLMRQQQSIWTSIMESNPFFSYLARHPQDN